MPDNEFCVARTRSGNTLRHVYDKSYRKSCFMRIRLSHVTQYNDFDVDSEEARENQIICILNQRFTYDLLYSLNKHRRWEFSDWVKSLYITDELNVASLSIDCHDLLNQSANCVELYSNVSSLVSKATSSEPKSRFASKSKVYFDRKSLSNPSNGETYLQVQVIHPLCGDSTLRYNLKKMRFEGNHKEKKNIKRFRMKNYQKLLRECKNDSQFDNVTLSNKISQEENKFHVPRRNLFLSDFISNFVPKIRQNKFQMKNYRTEPDNAVEVASEVAQLFIDQLKIEQSVTDVASADPQCSINQPVFVKIPSKEVGSSCLRQFFGNRVYFSSSEPLRIVVDMSGTRSAYFVFEYTGRSNVFAMALNSSLHSDAEIVDILQHSSYNINCAGTISVLSSYFIQKQQTSKISFRAARKPDKESKRITTWSLCESVPVEETTLQVLDTCSEVQLSRYRGQFVELLPGFFNVQTSGQCDICLKTWNSYDVDSDGRATSLQACAHVFCNSCWKSYLKITIQNKNVARSEMFCPAFNCMSQVDKATLLTFVSCKLYEEHEANIVSQLFNQKGYHFCEGMNCGRLLNVAHVKARNAICVCGKTVCPNCRKEAHWPSNCLTHRLYHEKQRKVKMNQIQVNRGIIVQGKKSLLSLRHSTR